MMRTKWIFHNPIWVIFTRNMWNIDHNFSHRLTCPLIDYIIVIFLEGDRGMYKLVTIISLSYRIWDVP